MTEDLQKFRKHLRKHLGEGSTTTYVRIVELALREHRSDPLKLVMQKHLSYNTRHTYIAALRAWAEFSENTALEERLHSTELLRKMRDSRRDEHRQRDRYAVQPFSHEQERSIWSTIRSWREDEGRPAWQWIAMSMMFNLGLRAGVDLACLTKKDVEAALRSEIELIIVTKGGKERPVPAVLVLDELRALSELDERWEIFADLVVSDRAPDSERKVQNAYERLRLCTKKLAEAVGIPPEEMHPHRFRHNVAQRLYAATKDIKKVQEILGHEDSRTTEGYLRMHRTEQIGKDLLAAMKRDLEE